MVPDHTGCAHSTTSGRIVSVPASGACSTTRVRVDVGGGGRLQMEWTYSYNLLERLNVSRNVQPRHYLIELHRNDEVSTLAGLNTQHMCQVVCMSRDVASHVIVSST